MKDDQTALGRLTRLAPRNRRTEIRARRLVSPQRILVIACLALLLMLPAVPSLIVKSNAQAAADIVALKTQLPVTIDGAPADMVWSQIQPTLVTLTGTTPSGGNVPQMWIKAAHDGKNLYLLMQWPDGKESRKSDRAIRLATSAPGNLIGQYKANATYHYTDAATVLWWIGSEKPTVSPVANNEFGGSPTRRATLYGWGANHKAESWVWKAYMLDLGNPYWPYSAIDPGVSKWVWGANAGKEYKMPYSAAFQGLFNTTGLWIFGDGLIHSKGCQLPGTTPFEVRARGVWSSGMWTLELSRPFVSSPENKPYTIPFEEGKTYWAALGAFEGNKGEWEEVGSKSGWVSMEVSKEFVPLEKQNQQTAAVATEATKTADAAGKTAVEATRAAGEASKTAADAIKTATDASKAADTSVKTATDASKIAGDASKAADTAVKTSSEASKTADTATKTAGEATKTSLDAQKVSSDALSSAQQAIRAAEDARKTAEATTNIAYATMGIAVVAIAVAIVMGLRKRS